MTTLRWLCTAAGVRSAREMRRSFPPWRWVKRRLLVVCIELVERWGDTSCLSLQRRSLRSSSPVDWMSRCLVLRRRRLSRLWSRQMFWEAITTCFLRMLKPYTGRWIGRRRKKPWEGTLLLWRNPIHCLRWKLWWKQPKQFKGRREVLSITRVDGVGCAGDATEEMEVEPPVAVAAVNNPRVKVV